ncbi:hypothetical protein IKJ53_02075 [bacterium]|nr:hypothetical protein [bacterium]
MNIFDTFDLFLKRPLSILRNGLVSLVHIRAENMFNKKAINVDLLEQKAQITVVNNEKVYNLLKLVMHKAKTNNINELVESKKTDTALLEVKE